MVAAWIKAETGVGPSIASGSQTYSGTCADLPAAPSSRSSPIVVSNPSGLSPTAGRTLSKSSDPQIAALEPGRVALDIWSVEGHHGLHDPGEGEQNRSNGDRADERVRAPAAEAAVDQEADQRERGNKPEVHNFIELTSSTFRV